MLDANNKTNPDTWWSNGSGGDTCGMPLSPVFYYFIRGESMGHDLLIGMNILKHTVIDFKSKRLRFSHEANVTSEMNSPSDLQLKLSMFNNVINGDAALGQAPVSDFPAMELCTAKESESRIKSDAALKTAPASNSPAMELCTAKASESLPTKGKVTNTGVNGAPADKKEPAQLKQVPADHRRLVQSHDER